MMKSKSILWAVLLTGVLFINASLNRGVHAVTKTNQPPRVLIVVDPGWSKFSLRIGEQIANQLKDNGDTVKLQAAKSFTLADLVGVELLILGGPMYAQQPSAGLKKAVQLIKPDTKLPTLVFAAGASKLVGPAAFRELAQARGLAVRGSVKFSVRDSDAELAAKISQLLELVDE